MKIENQISNYGTGNSINNLIIAHETANDKSTLDNEVKYMKGNWTAAFVTHFVGDGGRIIQTAPTGKISWGAGRYANPYSFAQVELCRTKDKDTFLKDYAAYIWLLRDLAKQGGIPQLADEGSSVIKKGIKTHRWVSENLGGTDHTDPYGYLASWEISKEQFKLDVKNGLGSVAPTPSYPTLTGSYTVKKGDTLWGIANTHKSTIENIKSLNSLKSNIIIPGQILKLSGSVAKPKPTKSIDTLVKETLAGDHGNGDERKKSLGSNYDTVMKVINGGNVHQAAPKRKRVYLPKSAKTWRVYKTSGPYTTGKEVGFLAPAQFSGLDYEIIKTLATDVYEIKTSTFDNVAIYAAKSTGATIR